MVQCLWPRSAPGTAGVPFPRRGGDEPASRCPSLPRFRHQDPLQGMLAGKETPQTHSFVQGMLKISIYIISSWLRRCVRGGEVVLRGIPRRAAPAGDTASCVLERGNPKSQPCSPGFAPFCGLRCSCWSRQSSRTRADVPHFCVYMHIYIYTHPYIYIYASLLSICS